MKRSIIATTCAIAAVAAAAAPAADAKGGGRVVKAAAHCTGTSTGLLKVKADDGRLAIELEVDQNRSGVRWNVRLADRGARVFAGKARTVAPSGAFHVRKLTANRAGADVITARATRAGETCTARVVF